MIKAKGDVYLYGKEINDETYAICKSDMMIKGNNPQNIRSGSTLSTDEFSSEKFDFMMSNPPYGKSWSSELKYIKDGKDIIDPRFLVELTDYWGKKETVDATPASSDGQLLFLMEMVSKMKAVDAKTKGSRIASVHNGSSLFTGDAAGGASNIRRHIIECDMLEAIIQMPNNLFYNTGITTYIWLLTNNKPDHRKGKVQLIEASHLFKKLRKNLGEKNCEFTHEHIQEIVTTYLNLDEVERDAEETGIAAKVFNNKDFGYYKVNIERPDRRKVQFTTERIETLRFDKTLKEPMQWAYVEWGDKLYDGTTLKDNEKAILNWCEENDITVNAKNRKKLLSLETWQKHQSQIGAATALMGAIGANEFNDFNKFKLLVDSKLKELKLRLNPADKKAILNAVSWYDENAEKVIKKLVKLNGDKLDNLLKHLGCRQDDLEGFGYYSSDANNEYITYEPNTDLRDYENVPLSNTIHNYFLREVKPHMEEAWINLDSTKIGYELSFNKYFYKYKPLRNMEEVTKDIIALEQQSEGLITDILGVSLEDVSAVDA